MENPNNSMLNTPRDNDRLLNDTNEIKDKNKNSF